MTSPAISSVEQLPDYAALVQLSRALWKDKKKVRGAAILIGAGFSANAELAADNTPRPPLWNDLASKMSAELYPGNSRHAPYDPLRLAEEYKIYLGQASLDEFIKKHIRDDAWRPGKLHRQLLNLPWSDVLTTNYDTLLERCSRHITSQKFDVVHTVPDLSHARAPRIVKLHGSIGFNENFVIAEEDYRRYPIEKAGFVNLVRQIFIENELCLLGFSGEDPNFVQWSGWVRDELGQKARRIYLVGALRLSSAKRRLLESRNVSPIDLAPLISSIDDRDLAHRQATSIFLDFLAASEPKWPHEWQPDSYSGFDPDDMSAPDWERRHKDHLIAAERLRTASGTWKAERLSYPGWIICPSRDRDELAQAIHYAAFPNKQNMELLPTAEAANVAYEITWRYATSFWPLDVATLAALDRFGYPVVDSTIGKANHLQIALFLARMARLNDDATEFDKWISVIEDNARPESVERAGIAYEKALYNRDRLDLARITEDKEVICGCSDPMWRIRFSLLLAEVGETGEAKSLISNVFEELNERQRQDPASLWILSRRAWVEWIVRNAIDNESAYSLKNRWPLEFTEARCDPWEEIQNLRTLISGSLERIEEADRSFSPSFEPGYYKDSKSSMNFVSPNLYNPSYALLSLMDTVGLPFYFNNVNFLGSLGKRAAAITLKHDAHNIKAYMLLVRALNSPSDKDIDLHFNRLRIAVMPPEVVKHLTSRLLTYTKFWIGQKSKFKQNDYARIGHANARASIGIEILSRLSPRQTEADAIDLFELGCHVASEIGRAAHDLPQGIGHLLDNSAQSVSSPMCSKLALLAAQFPFSHDGTTTRWRWPNPIKWLAKKRPVRPDASHEWENSISRLVENCRPGCPNRAEAAFRLVYLERAGLLRASEIRAASEMLWRATSEDAPHLPTETNLLPHAFLSFPSPSTDFDTIASVVNYIYIDRSKSVNESGFDAIINGASQYPDKLRPSADIATQLFANLTAWRPSEVDPKSFNAGFLIDHLEDMRKKIGEVLLWAVVPALAVEDRTAEKLDRLLALIHDAGVSTALCALPHLVQSCGDDATHLIVRAIRRGLLGRGSHEISSAAFAVEIWSKLVKSGELSTMPRPIVDQVIFTLESYRGLGLNSLIKSAASIFEMGFFEQSDLDHLYQSLDDIYIEMSYENIDPESRAAVTASLARAECVRFAKKLELAGCDNPVISKWLETSREDPLPEVRLALEVP